MLQILNYYLENYFWVTKSRKPHLHMHLCSETKILETFFLLSEVNISSYKMTLSLKQHNKWLLISYKTKSTGAQTEQCRVTKRKTAGEERTPGPMRLLRASSSRGPRADARRRGGTKDDRQVSCSQSWKTTSQCSCDRTVKAEQGTPHHQLSQQQQQQQEAPTNSRFSLDSTAPSSARKMTL